MGIADVADYHVDALVPLLGGQVLLTVQQHVENAHVAARPAHLLDDLDADVTASARHERSRQAITSVV
jgi:hypothetical protein